MNSVCVFFSFILDVKFVGCTSRGHTGRRLHRISHSPSFCGACLSFLTRRIQPFLSLVDREVEFLYNRSPLVVHFYFCERSELLINAASAKVLPACDSEHRSRRGGVRLAYRDPSRAIASSVYACFKEAPPLFFLGSASILATCPLLLRFGVTTIYTNICACVRAKLTT